MPVPDDVQAFFQTLRASRERGDKLAAHKEAQAKLYDAKLEEVRKWVAKLAGDLQQAFMTVVLPEHMQSASEVVLSYGGHRIAYGPSFDSSMIQIQPGDRQVGGEHLQVDQVTEEWVRKTTLKFLLQHLKADNFAHYAG